jgi:Anti-sigma-K factor rskA/Putative zinc-finger
VNTQPDDMHMLTGSYALDALTGPEQEDFERHLRGCASCADEVRGLRETAARLAMAKTVRPPARMQQRVLAATYQVRQLPPVVDESPERDQRRATVARLFAGRLPAGQRRRRVRTVWIPAAVAAASVAAAVTFGLTQVGTQQQLNAVRASGAAVTRIVQAPDARIEGKGTSVGGRVTVIFSGQQRAAVITAAGMTPPPAGQVYQLWVIGPASVRSAGLLTAADQAAPVLAGGIQPGDRIGITVEPSAGTASPTTTPVVLIPLTA